MACLLVSVAVLSAADTLEQSLVKLQSADVRVAGAAVRDIAQARAGEAALIERLANAQSSRLKVLILEALPLYQSTSTVSAMIAALDDPDPQVRQEAAIDLGFFGDNEQVAQALSKRLQNENNDAVKYSAVNTLGRHTSKTASSALGRIAAGSEKDARLKGSAVRVLGRMGTAESKTELKKFQNDADVGKEAKRLLKQK